MRAVAKAAPRSQTTPIPPPPAYQQHAVTVWLDHHVFEVAEWAYQYEQCTEGDLHPSGRTFEEFLADMIEGGLELPVARWHHKTAG
jgi:hypothetical protein